MLHSCAPKREVIEEPIANGKFEFLKDGETTKSEVIDQIGYSSRSYENGRIIIYHWTSYESKVYDIVMIFNEDNILERHSVIRVR